jgi:carboxypeptidase Taq
MTSLWWNELLDITREVARWDEVASVLGWDQQTQLPSEAHGDRAEQLALVQTTRHRRFAHRRVGELLHQLRDHGDLDDARRRGVENLLRDWTFAAAIPAEIVERFGRLQGNGHSAWSEARSTNTFGRLAPILGELVEVAQARAAAVDASRPAYDVLLEEFEPGMTSEQVAGLFRRLQPALVELLDALRGTEPMPVLSGDFSVESQRALCDELSAVMGYAGNQGRLDLSAHPFTSRLGDHDVRITTRIDPHDLWSNIGSTMHELGHALYEQGMPKDRAGTGLEGAPSMGMHESQSRFWENAIGRSRAFCGWLAPRLAARFGSALADPERLYRSANRVAPSLIRVEADEVTYNLHIIVRFELEKALIEGRLAVKDLPEAWNAEYERVLGIRPPSDADGVLQDVHWSAGAFGYFPTYTIGNLYAASLLRRLEGELPELWTQVGRGELAPILQWLRVNVHAQGRRHTAVELITRLTGQGDPVEDLVTHLWSRHGALHGVERPTRATSSPS